MEEVEPDKPLFDESEQQVTFVLTDDQGGIPTFFIFDAEDQKTTAGGINLLRGTPNEQGVEIRFEAVRFFRDENDPDKLWPRAVGIARTARYVPYTEPCPRCRRRNTPIGLAGIIERSAPTPGLTTSKKEISAL